ncbi:hypothetical protein [Vibrio phage vB_VibM_83AMN]|nr:hypothetical protein [Vibrio phage vB_VibM_83AMN]
MTKWNKLKETLAHLNIRVLYVNGCLYAMYLNGVQIGAIQYNDKSDNYRMAWYPVEEHAIDGFTPHSFRYYLYIKCHRIITDDELRLAIAEAKKTQPLFDIKSAHFFELLDRISSRRNLLTTVYFHQEHILYFNYVTAECRACNKWSGWTTIRSLSPVAQLIIKNGKTIKVRNFKEKE